VVADGVSESTDGVGAKEGVTGEGSTEEAVQRKEDADISIKL